VCDCLREAKTVSELFRWGSVCASHSHAQSENRRPLSPLHRHSLFAIGLLMASSAMRGAAAVADSASGFSLRSLPLEVRRQPNVAASWGVFATATIPAGTVIWSECSSAFGCTSELYAAFSDRWPTFVQSKMHRAAMALFATDKARADATMAQWLPLLAPRAFGSMNLGDAEQTQRELEGLAAIGASYTQCCQKGAFVDEAALQIPKTTANEVHDWGLRLGKSEMNRFMAMLPSSSASHTSGEPERHFCLFGFASLFNHSCVPNCVVAGSAVAMGDGTSVPIENITKGARILARGRDDNGRDGLVIREVKALLDQGKRECIEMLFDDGRTIVCTPDHRFLTAEGAWIDAKSMVVGETEVAASVEFPIVDCDSEPLVDLVWELDVKKHLGYSLNMHNRRTHALAFARLLGFALTDGTMTENQVTLFIGHHIDADVVEADVRVLVPSFNSRPTWVRNVWAIWLPASLSRALVAHATIGKRVERVSHFPAFICSSACPVAVVREFVGGLFGGDGCAPHVAHSGGTPVIYRNIRFVVTKKGAVLREQEQVLREELYPLLQRLGVSTTDLTLVCRSVGATSITAVGRAELSRQKSAGIQLSHTVRTSTVLEIQQSYTLVIGFRGSDTLHFMRNIGFRYCCHKQVRLTAAAVHERQAELIVRQRQFIIAHVKSCIAGRGGKKFGKGGLAKALQEAVRELSVNQILHPDVAIWCTKVREVQHLRVKSDKVGFTVAQSLERWATADFFSPARKKKPYKANSVPNDDAIMKDVLDPEDLSVHAAAPMEVDETEDPEDLTSIIDSSAEYPIDAADVNTDKEHVRYAVHSSARVLPFFKVKLIGTRQVGMRSVYDLSVPADEGDDFSSFSVAGLCAHNCMWTITQPVKAPNLVAMRIITLRDVRPGEELTHSYIDIACNSVGVRAAQLRAVGVSCRCRWCDEANNRVPGGEKKKKKPASVSTAQGLAQLVFAPPSCLWCGEIMAEVTDESRLHGTDHPAVTPDEFAGLLAESMSHPWFCDSTCQSHCLEDLDDFVPPPARASTAIFDATMALRALLQPIQTTKWSKQDQERWVAFQGRDQADLLAWLKAQLPAMIRASRAHVKQCKEKELLRKAHVMVAVTANIAAKAEAAFKAAGLPSATTTTPDGATTSSTPPLQAGDAPAVATTGPASNATSLVRSLYEKSAHVRDVLQARMQKKRDKKQKQKDKKKATAVSQEEHETEEAKAGADELDE
jgi:hypothetical protein